MLLVHRPIEPQGASKDYEFSRALGRRCGGVAAGRLVLTGLHDHRTID